MKTYNINDEVFISLDSSKSYPAGVSKEMIEKYNFQFATIVEKKDSNEYRIDLDDQRWIWNSEMFLCDEPKVPFMPYSKIFGDITINKISKDPNDKYPIEIILSDGDVINVTKNFKYFEDSERSII